MPGIVKLWQTGLESTDLQKMAFHGTGNLWATEGREKKQFRPTKKIKKREEQKISLKMLLMQGNEFT